MQNPAPSDRVSHSASYSRRSSRYISSCVYLGESVCTGVTDGNSSNLRAGYSVISPENVRFVFQEITAKLVAMVLHYLISFGLFLASSTRTNIFPPFGGKPLSSILSKNFAGFFSFFPPRERCSNVKRRVVSVRDNRNDNEGFIGNLCRTWTTQPNETRSFVDRNRQRLAAFDVKCARSGSVRGRFRECAACSDDAPPTRGKKGNIKSARSGCTRS